MATDSDLKLINRVQWGAFPPKKVEPMAHPIPVVRYIQNTGTKKCTNDEECTAIVQQLQKDHMADGLDDIRYNFLVGEPGKVYEGRGWFAKPPKDEDYAKYDGQYFEVALIGDYASNEWTSSRPWLTSPMCEGQFELLQEGVSKGYIIEDFGYIPKESVEELKANGVKLEPTFIEMIEQMPEN